jgi:hypothetical protein
LGRPDAAPLRRRLFIYPDPEAVPEITECSSISPYLIAGDRLRDPTTVVREERRPINGLRKLSTGTKPIDGGYYILTDEERDSLLRDEPGAADFIHPFIGGDEFINGLSRHLLVLEGATLKQLRAMPYVNALVQKVSQYRRGEIRRKDGSQKL